MFHTVGIREDQIYVDVYASWLRDTFEKSSDESKQLFREMVEAGFLDRQVVLRRQRLGVRVVSSLAAALHRSPLTKLDLHGNMLRDAGCEVVATALPDLPSLTYLDLGANGISGTGARALGFAIAQHNKLTVLDLSSRREEDTYVNTISAASAGTAVLLQGCLRCRTLRHLDLSGNQLGGGAVHAAGEAAAEGEEEAAAGGGDGPAAAGGAGTMGGDGGEEDSPLQSPVEMLTRILTRPGGSLVSLRLTDTGLTSADASRIVAALRANSSLTVLDLCDNKLPPVVGEDIGRLLLDRSALRCTAVLHTLHLSGNPLFGGAAAGGSLVPAATLTASGKVAQRLYSALSSSSPHRNAPAPSSLLLSALGTDRQIVNLALDRCGVDGTAVDTLCRSLLTNATLRSLSLKDNAIKSDAAVELGRALCTHPCLQKLYLAGNALGDEGCCALAAVIGDRGASAGDTSCSTTPRCGRSVSFSPDTFRPKSGGSGAGGAGGGGGEPGATLETLDLQRAWLGDRGLVALGVALQSNTTVRVLLLGGNHFSAAGGDSFAALLEGNMSVVVCALGATSVPCPTVLRLQRCIARNRKALEQSESSVLRREVVRLHFLRYKLEEAKIEREALRDRSVSTKLTSDNMELQFKQDQSDLNKRLRELEEQAENYIAEEERYGKQAAQLEEDLKKNEVLFAEDMALTKERLDAEMKLREEAEAAHKAVEAELDEWKNNGEAREKARQEQVAATRLEMEQWAGQAKEYRAEAEELQRVVRELEARATSSAGKKGKKSKKAA